MPNTTEKGASIIPLIPSEESQHRLELHASGRQEPEAESQPTQGAWEPLGAGYLRDLQAHVNSQRGPEDMWEEDDIISGPAW
jgi:hypothetical protein